jgi:hypothetical protein
MPRRWLHMSWNVKPLNLFQSIFIPELNYDDLEISDGDMASRNYSKCLKGMVSNDVKNKIYDDLKRYCEMDT